MQKFLSLRVEAFHNSIALTDHVVVSVAIIGRRNNFNKFSGWPGPGWSSPGISISLKHLDRHIFFLQTQIAYFFRHRGYACTTATLRSQTPTGTFTFEISALQRGVLWTGMINSRACKILLTQRRLWGHLHKPGPMRSSPGQLQG